MHFFQLPSSLEKLFTDHIMDPEVMPIRFPPFLPTKRGKLKVQKMLLLVIHAWHLRLFMFRQLKLQLR